MTASCKVRIVCISDTHNHAPGEGYTLPKGDVLIHAGDLSNQGSFAELQRAFEWISKAEYACKIVVGGNHDIALDPASNPNIGSEENTDKSDGKAQRDQLLAIDPGILYLQHTSASIDLPHKNVRFTVFGSPYSQRFEGRGKWAFQYDSSEAREIWQSVPTGTDVLITHTPSKGSCDSSHHWAEGGCPVLAEALRRIRPALHVCGHCHEGRGATVMDWVYGGRSSSGYSWVDPGKGNKKQSLLDLARFEGVRSHSRDSTAIVNASIMAKSHGHGGVKTFNKPIVIDLLLPTI